MDPSLAGWRAKKRRLAPEPGTAATLVTIGILDINSNLYNPPLCF